MCSAAASWNSSSNYITSHYAGSDLAGIRRRVLREMRRPSVISMPLMARQWSPGPPSFGDLDDDGKGDFVVASQTNLMDFDELAQMDVRWSLSDASTEKQKIPNLPSSQP